MDRFAMVAIEERKSQEESAVRSLSKSGDSQSRRSSTLSEGSQIRSSSQKEEVRTMEDHQLKWNDQLRTVLNEYNSLRFKQVDEMATQLINDTERVVRELADSNKISNAHPEHLHFAYSFRSMARINLNDWIGSADDVSMCLFIILGRTKCDFYNERRKVDNTVKIRALITRGRCLKNLGDLNGALRDTRECCAAIRGAGDSYKDLPTLNEAVIEALTVMALKKIVDKTPRPHYSELEKLAIQKEFGIWIYEKENRRCHTCGISDMKKLKLCKKCRTDWFCTEACSRVSRSNPTDCRQRVASLKYNGKVLAVQDSEKESLKQHIKERAYHTFTGPCIILQDPDTGVYFDSLTDKTIFFVPSQDELYCKALAAMLQQGSN